MIESPALCRVNRWLPSARGGRHPERLEIQPEGSAPGQRQFSIAVRTRSVTSAAVAFQANNTEISTDGYAVIRTANFRDSGLATIQLSKLFCRCRPAATTAASSSGLRSCGTLSELKIVMGMPVRANPSTDARPHGSPRPYRYSTSHAAVARCRSNRTPPAVQLPHRRGCGRPPCDYSSFLLIIELSRDYALHCFVRWRWAAASPWATLRQLISEF